MKTMGRLQHIDFLTHVFLCLSVVCINKCKALQPVQPSLDPPEIGLVAPSEYASIGMISQYVGHINDLTGLKAALTACSYKNEVIFISTTSTFVDAAAQTIDMLR